MIKKFILVILGIILSLAILECGLRLAGFTISSYQQYRNNKALKNKSQYTIMCLGESTTAWQYPVQLQEILNKKYPNKFSVADCGIPGTNLETILDLLNENIKKYNPDMAICMMGINNGFTLYDQKKSSNKYINKELKINLKVYKLFIILKEHISNLLKPNNLFASELNKEEISTAIKLYSIGEYTKAVQLCNKLLNQNINYKEQLYPYLVSIYCCCLTENDKDKGLELAIEAINSDFQCWRQIYFEVAIVRYYDINKIDQATLLANRMVDENIEVSLRIYRLVKKLLTPDNLKKVNNSLLVDDSFYALSAINALEKKDYKKAKEYFNEANEIRLNYPNLETYKLYKLIVKKLIDNNIKVICIQYPVRSIIPLQEQLKNEPYYNKITFISNEKLFKEALMKKSYDEIFVDQFAGDFGHCTDLGNTMIAKNVVKTLENILNLKQN